ncbi:helix-turn-helix domain-containing protein [Nocardia sp. NEAU-G5]|uniref:Helix-turn-helix domain-containing protein n=1 Tax=Nocardia albiluteola TaxID=2842303 RepID=A0ABS6AZC7_9NOCA|nr:helix-turn-helix domain-containing protein [Nocardia albiluteola]MBU3062354.1 helix-turn-helix domain-containing protein [Nocardia albiluteola]
MPDIVASTDEVNPPEREDYWHHVLGDTFAPVNLEGWDRSPDPVARLEGTVRGRLLFAELTASSHIHRRTPRCIQQSDAAFFQIAVLTDGSASLEQDSRIAELTPGDFVVYENSRPFTWTFTRPWSVSVLSVPSDAVPLSDRERRTVSGRVLSGQHGLSGVVGRFVLDLIRHGADVAESQSEEILARTTDLAVCLLAEPDEVRHADAAQRSLMTRIKAYIEQHLQDSALTPTEIAAAANISTRYLHKLFQAENESVALYIRRRRLARVREELLDRRLAHLNITTLAHRSGFGDISGFNRAFRATYGISPGEMRRGHSEPGSTPGVPTPPTRQ